MIGDSYSLTYEATKARQSTWSQPDKIHWSSSTSFRDNPYRQLHHQKGLIGIFKVQLLECSNLKRSYWSAFALGPVKHLGLSKAHGPISSYCTFGINYSLNKQDENGNSNSSSNNNLMTPQNLNQKPSALNHNNNNNNNNVNRLWNPSNPHHDTVRSSVIPDDDNPVWSTGGSGSEFILPLRKGSMVYDGMSINLLVRVDEDNAGVENVLKNVGVAPSDEERLLGVGKVDITSLCLGESISTSGGSYSVQPQVGVLDVWIPIQRGDSDNDSSHHEQQQMMKNKKMFDEKDSGELKKPGKSTDNEDSNNNNSKITGRVRVLVSYTPTGLEPQHNDWVAMECYARRSLKYSSCRPLLPPLYPMKVIDVRGSYVLVEYTLMRGNGNNGGHGSRRNNNNNNRNKNNARRNQKQRNGTIRIHRNAIFVIERTNIVDGAINLACLPTDIIMSTPIGKKTSDVVGPVVSAAGELIMPAILTGKILMAAVKTTASAGITGVVAATSAVGHAAMENQNKYRQEASFHSNSDQTTPTGSTPSSVVYTSAPSAGGGGTHERFV